MGVIIAVVNQKGGAGKSTVAVNLAACLAGHGERVLVVDSDPQGTASTLLGVDIWSLDHTMSEVMTRNHHLSDLVKETEIKGLFIAPTNNDLSSAEAHMENQAEGGYILKQEIQKIVDSPLIPWLPVIWPWSLSRLNRQL